MNKKLKITGIILLLFFAVIYLFYILILPAIATHIINGQKSEIQKIVNLNSGLALDYSNLKVITTPMLAAGIKADSIVINMPDGKSLIKTGETTFRISLPSLLLKTIKISYAKIVNPTVDIDIVNGSGYAILDLLAAKTKPDESVSAVDNAEAVTYDFKYKVDKFIIENYKININDLKTSHYLSLKGNEFILKYDEKNLSLKTKADLFSDENKNITADIDIKTFIPEAKSVDSNSENNDITFINPVEMYMKYDLKTNVLAKLEIKNKDEKTKITGHIDITDTTVKIGSMQLPKSYMQLKFDGQKLNIDTNLYLTDKENAKVNGIVNYSDKPSLDVNIKSDKIYLSSILKLSTAIMDSLNIKNSLSSISAEGYIYADTKIKTDYKKLDSAGKIELAGGYISDKKTGLKITNMKSLLSFENNMLNIKDTEASINGTPFIVAGKVTQDSSADINIYTKNLPLSSLYATFAPADLKKSYMVTGGILSLNIDLKGKLQQLKPIIKTEVVNLIINDKADGITISNGLSNINISTDLKTYQGNIQNSNLVISAPALSTTIRNAKAVITFDEKDIAISPSEFVINGTSKISLSGDIKNYVKSPDINITGNGTLMAAVLKNLAGKDAAPYLSAKGSIPVKLLITGNNKKQDITFRMYGTAKDYITPVNFAKAAGKNSAVQIKADISENKITFKNSGLYTSVSGDMQQDISGQQLASLTGSIVLDKDMTLNSINISTTGVQNISICAFDKSSLLADANITITGTAANPKINGSIKASNISIPQLLTKISKASLNLNGNTFGYEVSELNLNGSSINISGSGLLDYKPVITLYGVKVTSDYIDADKVIKVSDAALKIPVFAPTQSTSGAISTKSSSSAQTLPVKITSGSVNIQKIKSGDIYATDINSKLTLSNNVVYLNDLKASSFDGNITGNVSMNIISSQIKLKVNGSDLDADKTVTACAAMKNTISGTLGFNADLSLQGATYEEQMKTLKGNADFTITKGQFGSLGRFETFLKADNLASVAFISTATGTLINKVSPHNTAEFAKLNGAVSFSGGNMNISSITSSGKNMSLYITGKMNLLNNNANMLVLGRISSEISSLLGPLNQINPINILKSKNSTWAAVTVGILDTLNQAATPSEMNKIPPLTPQQDDLTTSKFVVKINGNIEKPQSAIKSFRWLSSQTDLTEAQNVINPVTSVKEVINSLPKTKEETVNTIKEAGKNAILNFGKQFLTPSSTETKEE